MNSKNLVFAFASSVFLFSGGSALGADCIDADGDGYGWDGVDTCDPNASSGNQNNGNNNNQTNSGSGACVDADGDGYGWDGVRSCDPNASENQNNGNNTNNLSPGGLESVFVGDWKCYNSYVDAGPTFNSSSTWGENNQAGCYIDPSRRGITYSVCDVNWQAGSFLNSWQDAAGNPGAITSEESRYVFRANGTLTYYGSKTIVYPVNGGAAIHGYVGGQEQRWNLNGFQLTVNGQAKHRFSFERYNGQDYMSIYEEDESRVVCKK